MRRETKSHAGPRAAETDERAAIRRRRRTGDERVPAWEEIEAGRYMPRRIRGSFRGRELG